MALNVPQKVYSDGQSQRICVYRVFGVTAGDTWNVATDFVKVSMAFFTSTSQVFTTNPAISSNTVLTPGGGLALDDGYLLVYGAGIQQ